MFESKKNNKKAILFSRAVKNVSALGVQTFTSQLLIKPDTKIIPRYCYELSVLSIR